MTMALVHYGYGGALSADIRYEPIARPTPDQTDVVVEVLESPINPSDINVIEGRYVFQPSLPAVLGREGVGRVIAVGASVTRCRLGDRVISIAPHHRNGFWATHTIADETDWWVVPDFIPTEVATHLAINGLTAYLLLTDCVALMPGDFVLQNAPRSSVAAWVRYFATALGLNCVELDRDSGAIPGSAIRVGLNAVGGDAVAVMSQSLTVGATIVTYGALSKVPPKISNTALIFKEQVFRGFLRSRWVETRGVERTRDAFHQMATLLESRPFMAPDRQTFALPDFREALACVGAGYRGKVVFRL